jgi:transposase
VPQRRNHICGSEGAAHRPDRSSCSIMINHAAVLCHSACSRSLGALCRPPLGGASLACRAADGYDGYGGVAKRNDIISVGCLAHARRKFDEALKAQKQKDRGGLAKQGLELIQRIYHVERDARTRQVDADQRKTLRDEKAKPVWNELRLWLDQARGQVPPKSLTGKALGYLDKQWPRLIRVLDDGRIEIDNNQCENAIRPFVMGRKAWLFSDTPAGADASARLYSLIETAKANGVEPYAYLRHVFTQLPKATTADDIEALLPWNVVLGDA